MREREWKRESRQRKEPGAQARNAEQGTESRGPGGRGPKGELEAQAGLSSAWRELIVRHPPPAYEETPESARPGTRGASVCVVFCSRRCVYLDKCYFGDVVTPIGRESERFSV